MKEVGFVSCCVGISRVEHKDFFWGVVLGLLRGSKKSGGVSRIILPASELNSERGTFAAVKFMV